MRDKTKLLILLAVVIVAIIAPGVGDKASAVESKVADVAETKHWLLQVWPRMLGYPDIPPLPGHRLVTGILLPDANRSACPPDAG